MQSGLLLIALGFGYTIFAQASVKTKKSLQQLSRIIGIAMMVVSACGIVCSTWSCISRAQNGECFMGSEGHHKKRFADFDNDGYGKKRFCPVAGSETNSKTLEISLLKGGLFSFQQSRHYGTQTKVFLDKLKELGLGLCL